MKREDFKEIKPEYFQACEDILKNDGACITVQCTSCPFYSQNSKNKAACDKNGYAQYLYASKTDETLIKSAKEFLKFRTSIKTVKCVDDNGCIYIGELTKGKIYEVLSEEESLIKVKNNMGEVIKYRKSRFEEVNMKKEKVLELEFQEVFDKVAVRIKYQNETVLKRNEFKDEEIGVISTGYPDFSCKYLYLRGRSKEDDDNVSVITKEKAEEVMQKVHAINEKYGVYKRWRATYGGVYFYINAFGKVIPKSDSRLDGDNKRYYFGNYFRTKEEAERVLDKIKPIFMEG